MLYSIHNEKQVKRFVMSLLTVIIVGVFFSTMFVRSAHAATLFLSANKDVVSVGDTLEVLIKTDSEDVGINAVQATLQYPKDILAANKIEKMDSIFNFWLEEPKISNDTGRITFVGGSTAGQSGKSLQILKVVFSVKGVGRAQLTFTDGAITASDGSGTNVLSSLNGFVINSIPTTGLTKGTSLPLQTQAPKPIQITRPAVLTEILPAVPTLTVPLYPEQKTWHADSGSFLVQWKLPPDVSGVSTALDQNITYDGTTSEGLFDSKVFPPITKDGVWYVHVRFKNNKGWGPAAHYRIALDTHPPLEFELLVSEGNPTDVPSPHIQFLGKDLLSSIKEYHLQVGGADVIKISSTQFSGSYQLPLQSPGGKTITVKAFDEAGNSVEKSMAVEIKPIASPTITFVTRELFSDADYGLIIKGVSLPNVNILLRVYKQKVLIVEEAAHSDEKGNWEFAFGQAFKNGNYSIAVQAQDARGALSLVVQSENITVKNKPIFQLGPIQLGIGGVAIFLLFVVVGGFSIGVLFYRKKQEKIGLRVVATQSDIKNIFRLLQEDVERLSKAQEAAGFADNEYALKKLQEHVTKMEHYLKIGVEKIKK
jgi:hypothetical protein